MATIWVGGAALLLAAAALATAWLSRFVTARRLNAAANAYAEREIARARRRADVQATRAAR